MFSKLFGRRRGTADGETTGKPEPLIRPVEQARAADPIVHLKIGAEEIVQRLISALANEHGVHIESLLALLGSLAGFCAIDGVLKQAVASNQSFRDYGIAAVETSDGARYYFGDPVNALLVGSDRSLWALVAGIVDHLGSRDYPDFQDIAGHVAQTVGGPAFGRPRVPADHRPGDIPVQYVRTFWPHILPIVERHVPILEERVMLFGYAVQTVIIMGKDVIPASVAGKLVMECAVPMARLDPASLLV